MHYKNLSRPSIAITTQTICVEIKLNQLPSLGYLNNDDFGPFKTEKISPFQMSLLPFKQVGDFLW